LVWSKVWHKDNAKKVSHVFCGPYKIEQWLVTIGGRGQINCWSTIAHFVEIWKGKQNIFINVGDLI
jgi:hypothetical protein